MFWLVLSASCAAFRRSAKLARNVSTNSAGSHPGMHVMLMQGEKWNVLQILLHPTFHCSNRPWRCANSSFSKQRKNPSRRIQGQRCRRRKTLWRIEHKKEFNFIQKHNKKKQIYIIQAHTSSRCHMTFWKPSNLMSLNQSSLILYENSPSTVSEGSNVSVFVLNE